MNKPVELIIFDWDGTLFDSVGQIVASLQFAAQQFAQPLTDADAKSIIGLGLPEVAQRIRSMEYEPVGSSSEAFARFIEKDAAQWAAVVKKGNIVLD